MRSLLMMLYRGWGRGKPADIETGQLADAVDRHIGRRIGEDLAGVVRVLPLAWEHAGDARAPVLLYARQDAKLVVHHHVVMRRIAALDRIEHPLLVDEDQYAPADRIP